ncbi:hypothetical protein SV7mr_24220 [Stieleria bergensis]|uniref:Protein SlyX n=1 Tax=Stieleria bergensis TaxID=2528025 RepID=A0A517SUW2_9BACT|nr:MAG: hypothetical protein CBB71_14845 [Rhodopirellula sp. TMED11]QDT59909.1 hypothetical protein SV7mr_24220 [Planctomycetes bacterium SV_7m_r]
MKTDAERIADLEIELAHMQRLCDQLNEVVTEQALVLDKAMKQIKKWDNRFNDLKSSLDMSHSDERDPLAERPPHY